MVYKLNKTASAVLKPYKNSLINIMTKSVMRNDKGVAVLYLLSIKAEKNVSESIYRLCRESVSRRELLIFHSLKVDSSHGESCSKKMRRKCSSHIVLKLDLSLVSFL